MSRVAALLRRLWALPVSLVALPLLALARLGGGRVRIADGVIEADGGWLPLALRALRPRAHIQAITLGHVVLARDARAQERYRAHEREHVRQCERWGLLFPAAYLAASALALLRGGEAYRDNHFEVAARAREDAVQRAHRPEYSARGASASRRPGR